MNIFLTGDTHGQFDRIKDFCQKMQTKKEDILIILGDAGINFSGLPYDDFKYAEWKLVLQWIFRTPNSI